MVNDDAGGASAGEETLVTTRCRMYGTPKVGNHETAPQGIHLLVYNFLLRKFKLQPLFVYPRYRSQNPLVPL